MGLYDTALDSAMRLVAREVSEETGEEGPQDAVSKEKYMSWSILILDMLLIFAFFTSYYLRSKKIQAVQETVVFIFSGMVIGLLLRLTQITPVLGAVSFDSSYFFNLLLPPIILASGFELHQNNFFRNIGAILTFAFAGTFISAIVLSVILWLWALIPLEGLEISYVNALAVGATLSATDPVTILAIFNTYKVDPKLYTIIFGESILNDAVSIVLFQTARKYVVDDPTTQKPTILNLFESIGVFLLSFFGSLIVGIIFGVATSLLLKFTHVRRDPKIESCLVFLIAYSSYFFANAVDLSGIVALLFCGICLKHYAYHNMSRRSQLTIKFTFQLMSQLMENFIFIYLGLSLFTDTEGGAAYKPLFILVTVIGTCVARWCAVFPLSGLINWVIRYRARRRGQEGSAEEIPANWQMMLFWAGLRGAVGVALAADLPTVLRATILVTVVLTVIIFGGTAARMLEILNIRTGVVEELDSDDEFDIEPVPRSGGAWMRKNGAPYGNGGKGYYGGNGAVGLDDVGHHRVATYSTGSSSGSPPTQPEIGRRNSGRRDRGNSMRRPDDAQNAAEQGLFRPEDDNNLVSDDEADDLGLPPAARRAPIQHIPLVHTDDGSGQHSSTGSGTPQHFSARGAISQILNATTEDAGSLFSKLDENFLKPHLLLDPGGSSSNRHPGNGGSS